MADFSDHARRRSEQRAIADEHIELALTWGADIRQHDGRIAYHLGFREVSRARAEGIRIPERAIGVAVVVADDGTLVTAVRSPDRTRLQRHGWRSHRRASGRRG